jgi:single-stranded-DNA-specific exonuclease
VSWSDEERPVVGRRRWQVADSLGLAGSAVEAAYSPLLARALWARRLVTPEACADWLALHRAALPAWETMPDLPAAVERVADAIRAGQPVAVFGDYDVDGLAATAIVALTLQAHGMTVAWRLPNRVRDGYGLNLPAIETLADWLRARQPDGRPLLLVVDCGTGNQGEIDAAVARGLDVVVLDHHTVSGELPAALALVNPKRTDRAYPDRDLTAAGLACALARGLLARDLPLAPAVDREALKRDVLALAALGTTADVAPLTGDNRLLVAWGLRALRSRQRPGVAALLRVAGVEPARVTAETLVWRLAPRLNAAGRMRDPAPALRLLLTNDPAEAAALAAELDTLNRQRQIELERMLMEARAMLAMKAAARIPVLAGDGWSPGLVGLVAGRLAEETGRPVIVLGLEGELARGSARSQDGFNITEALASAGQHLERFGGHSQAAGLTVRRDQIDALARALDRAADAAWPAGPPDPALRLDGVARLGEFRRDYVADLACLEPLGRGNEEPVWLVEGARLMEARPVGASGQHLQLRVTDGVAAHTAIAFRLGDRRDELSAARWLDLACVARLSVWQGRERVELQVRDVRPAESPSP